VQDRRGIRARGWNVGARPARQSALRDHEGRANGRRVRSRERAAAARVAERRARSTGAAHGALVGAARVAGDCAQAGQVQRHDDQQEDGDGARHRPSIARRRTFVIPIATRLQIRGSGVESCRFETPQDAESRHADGTQKPVQRGRREVGSRPSVNAWRAPRWMLDTPVARPGDLRLQSTGAGGCWSRSLIAGPYAFANASFFAATSWLRCGSLTRPSVFHRYAFSLCLASIRLWSASIFLWAASRRWCSPFMRA